MTENIIYNYIAQNGFISLDTYMQLCLQHDIYGYYRTANPLGKQGDFVTAPEISQLFGELIGIFVLFHLEKIFPDNYQICELGAGRGILATDYLRVLKQKPPDDIFFLEINTQLQEQQSTQIPSAKHIHHIDELPQKPTLFIANEFFDALPIKAFKLFGSEQSEIIITLDTKQKLQFDYATPTKNTTSYYHGYYETSSLGLNICYEIGVFIKHHQGAFLCCDYGYTTSTNKLTFRGFKNHYVTDGLQSPFQEDLTADVNFIEIMDCFYQQDLAVYDIITQAEFLKALHIDTRLHHLLRNVTNSDTKQQLICGVQKLLSVSEMGERFKFLFISHKKDEFYPFLKTYPSTRLNNANT